MVGFDPYGTPPPLTTTGGGTGTVPGLVGPQTAIAQAQQAFLQGTAAGTTPQQQLQAAQQYLAVLNQQKAIIDHLSGSARQDLTVQRELLTITRDILAAKKLIASATVSAQAERILGLGPGGVPTIPGVQALQFRIHENATVTIQ